MASANPISEAASNEEGPAANRGALDDLLNDYLAEARGLAVLAGRHDAALVRLPAWAVAGFSLLYSDGRRGGAIVGWPEVASLPAPDAERTMVYRLIRPSIREVWHRATLMMAPAGNPTFADVRRRQRLAGFSAVRRVIARMREQRAERVRVGLPAIEEALIESHARRDAIERSILALSTGTTAAEIAVTATFELLATDGECALALDLLRRLAPDLSGVLRLIVEDLIMKGADALDDPTAMDRTMMRGAVIH